MKKSGFLFLGLFLLPSLVFASVRINEIMYDLDGSDTVENKSREWIEIFNDSAAEVNLSDWKFNDGDNATNHGLNEPPKNGGQGSLAIPAQRFVIFAADATVFLSEHSGYSGTVIDTVMSLNNTSATLKLINAEGNEVYSVAYEKTMGANDDGNSLQYAAGNWIAAAPTPGAVNSGSSEPQPTQESQSQSSSSGSGSSSYIPPENLPKIKAYAGEDKTAVVGAAVEFRGQAFGLKDEPLDNARYLWSFGDGTSKEGQNTTHFYQYPGEYIVVLNVSSGEYAASDSLLIKASPNQLSISESKPGFGGWIELYNGSKEQIDVSGCQLKSGNHIFIFPKSTFIRPSAYLVIPVSVSVVVLAENKGVIELLYPGGFKAGEFYYEGLLKDGESFSFTRDNKVGVITKETPGAANLISQVKTNVSSQEKSTSVVTAQSSENQKALSKEAASQENDQNIDKETGNVAASAIGVSASNNKIYYLAVLGLIIFAAGAVLLVRRHGQA